MNVFNLCLGFQIENFNILRYTTQYIYLAARNYIEFIRGMLDSWSIKQEKGQMGLFPLACTIH